MEITASASFQGEAPYSLRALGERKPIAYSIALVVFEGLSEAGASNGALRADRDSIEPIRVDWVPHFPSHGPNTVRAAPAMSGHPRDSFEPRRVREAGFFS
jgi:hypothetical protein